MTLTLGSATPGFIEKDVDVLCLKRSMSTPTLRMLNTKGMSPYQWTFNLVEQSFYWIGVLARR